MISWITSWRIWRRIERLSWRTSRVGPKVAPKADAPDQASAAEKHLVGLPLLVVGPVDVGRLIRELEAIDDQLLQAHLRNTESRLPKMSQLMEQTVELNKLNLLHDTDRKRLHELLATVREQAPVLHVSFSADPSP